jgi:maleylacetoacetate isomerase
LDRPTAGASAARVDPADEADALGVEAGPRDADPDADADAGGVDLLLQPANDSVSASEMARRVDTPETRTRITTASSHVPQRCVRLSRYHAVFPINEPPNGPDDGRKSGTRTAMTTATNAPIVTLHDPAGNEAAVAALPPITLFHYWRSSSSLRVRWALAIKGVPYTSVHVNLLAGEQHEGPHAERNPLGYVPALRIGTVVLSESVAICELLDELIPTPPIRPRDPMTRARMRQLVEIVNAGTQPLQNLLAMRKAAADTEAQRDWARFWVARGLAAFESVLHTSRKEGHTGRHCLGDHLSMADLFLVPQLYNARRFDLPLAAYPLCLELEERATATESYELARAESWQHAAAP